MGAYPVTLLLKNTDGLKASLRAKTARKKQRLLQATTENAQDVKETVQALCPVDTGYMRDHVRAEIGGKGDRFSVGWRASDFIGKTNPATGLTITAFYPFFVVHGTRHMAGRDFPTAALQLRKAQILRRYRAALAG